MEEQRKLVMRRNMLKKYRGIILGRIADNIDRHTEDHQIGTQAIKCPLCQEYVQNHTEFDQLSQLIDPVKERAMPVFEIQEDTRNMFYLALDITGTQYIIRAHRQAEALLCLKKKHLKIRNLPHIVSQHKVSKMLFLAYGDAFRKILRVYQDHRGLTGIVAVNQDPILKEKWLAIVSKRHAKIN